MAITASELERINNVPLYGTSTLDPDMQRWMLTLVDSLNTTIQQIEDELISLDARVTALGG
jgi:hypothetical protein